MSTALAPSPADLWGPSGTLAVPRHQRRWVLARPRRALVWVTVEERQRLVDQKAARARARGNAAEGETNCSPRPGALDPASSDRESSVGLMLFTEGR